jgi:hypothetical protein
MEPPNRGMACGQDHGHPADTNGAGALTAQVAALSDSAWATAPEHTCTTTVCLRPRPRPAAPAPLPAAVTSVWLHTHARRAAALRRDVGAPRARPGELIAEAGASDAAAQRGRARCRCTARRGAASPGRGGGGGRNRHQQQLCGIPDHGSRQRLRRQPCALITTTQYSQLLARGSGLQHRERCSASAGPPAFTPSSALSRPVQPSTCRCSTGCMF